MSQTTNPYLTDGSSSTNPLAPYYEDKRTKAGDEKDSSLKDLSASRSLQRQEAAINHELLKKYLPELNAANGLTGLGVSESFNLDSLSRYQNTLSDIERSYQSGVSEVKRAYNDRISQIDTEERNEYTTNKNSEYDTAMSQINYGLYTTAEDLESYIDTLTFLDNDQKAQLWETGMGVIKNNEQEKTDKETDINRENADREYDEAYTWIAAGYIDNEEDLDKFIEGFTYLDEAQKSKLKNYGMQIIDEVEETKSENEGSTTASGTISDTGETVNLPIGSRSVTLYVAGETENADVISYANDKKNGVENNGVFLYGNNVYYKNNGHVFELYDKNGGVTDEFYSIAYDYLKNGTIPDGYGQYESPDTPQSERIDRFDRPRIKYSGVRDGKVYYKDTDGTEKAFSNAYEIPQSYWTSDLTGYKDYDNLIFESDGGHYMWQNGNLYHFIP